MHKIGEILLVSIGAWRQLLHAAAVVGSILTDIVIFLKNFRQKKQRL
jgi:hypothetical protein